jgi:serine/threonine-protein kinase RsbW
MKDDPVGRPRAARSAVDALRAQLGRMAELRIAATADQLPVLRDTMEAIALREDFDLDTVADLKMAADTAASILIERAPEDTELYCGFWRLPDRIRVTMNAASRETLPARDDFGWHVLAVLTDDFEVEEDAADFEGHPTSHIDFVRYKESRPA